MQMAKARQLSPFVIAATAVPMTYRLPVRPFGAAKLRRTQLPRSSYSFQSLALRHSAPSRLQGSRYGPTLTSRQVESAITKGLRSFQSSATYNMSAKAQGIETVLSAELLESVRSYWFSHIVEQDTAVIPRMLQMRPWFMGEKEFDEGCM